MPEIDYLDLLESPESAKVLVTTSQDGSPHAAITDFLRKGPDGSILYLEPLESSLTNKNLVRAIWFDGRVAIALSHPDGRRVELRGRPERALIAGPYFQEHYQALQEQYGDIDLAAVWVILIEHVANHEFLAVQRREEQNHFFFRHLDRIAVQ
jgi:hypothetical protein